MYIELPPSGYEKSPETCSGMLMFMVINAKIVFTTTGVAFSVNGSSTKYVSLSFPTNATIANADQYYWRPMTGYTATGSLGVMELRQTSSTVADALIRNFATTTVSSSIYVVWIGNLL